MSNGPSHFQELVGIVERLRAPGGCPWDREQTHGSLKRHLLEEAYEVMEAIDAGDPSRLQEELGDLLVQVVFHAQMAREAQDFDVEAVVSTVSDKLVRRHPHVFADSSASDAREVELNWERLKEKERGHRSPVEGIPRALPALSHSQLMQDRVSKAGFEWEDVSGVLDKVAEEAGELVDAPTDEERAREYGDLLFVMVNLARVAEHPGRGRTAAGQRPLPGTVPRHGAPGLGPGPGLPRHAHGRERGAVAGGETPDPGLDPSPHPWDRPRVPRGEAPPRSTARRP